MLPCRCLPLKSDKIWGSSILRSSWTGKALPASVHKQVTWDGGPEPALWVQKMPGQPRPLSSSASQWPGLWLPCRKPWSCCLNRWPYTNHRKSVSLSFLSYKIGIITAPLLWWLSLGHNNHTFLAGHCSPSLYIWNIKSYGAPPLLSHPTKPLI